MKTCSSFGCAWGCEAGFGGLRVRSRNVRMVHDSKLSACDQCRGRRRNFGEPWRGTSEFSDFIAERVECCFSGDETGLGRFEYMGNAIVNAVDEERLPLFVSSYCHTSTGGVSLCEARLARSSGLKSRISKRSPREVKTSHRAIWRPRTERTGGG